MNRKSRRAARHNPQPPSPPHDEPAPPAATATLHFPTPPAPVAARLLSLDLLRGFAVMGILLMNIVSFAMPEAAYVNPRAWGPQSGADTIGWMLSFVLVDGKMRGLFALLFGASMLLVMERAAMEGRDPVRTHLVRMAWLLVIGVAHFLFLWWGDILMLYAGVGALACLLAGREPLALAKLAFLCFGVQIAIVLTTMVPAWFLASAATGTGADGATVDAYRSLLDSFGQPGSEMAAREAALYLGPWTGIVADHLRHLPSQIVFSLFYFGAETVGFMLLGMALLKGGFLTGGWTADQYVRTARHTLLIGLPPMIGLAFLCWYRDFSTLTVFGSFILWSFPWRISLTVGYAALILWLLSRVRGDRPAALLVRVGAVGRAALSNYLGSSLAMTAIFYGWGLGLFGSVPRLGLYAFVVGAWAMMLLWSKPWLEHFAYGPFEWLWRSLARGRPQKIRR